MCTVTYLPYTSQGFIITSNRDEVSTRQTISPSKYSFRSNSLYYPKDALHKGTWIATSSNGYTLCLLNGAFEKHEPINNYRRSRGLVLLDFFIYNNPNLFSEHYDFNGIEPFTLIMIGFNGKVSLSELRWDGYKVYFKFLKENEPYIWSSSTLYSKEIIQSREKWFKDWLNKNPVYSQEQILFFHHFGGERDKENSLIINRKDRMTVSITSVINTPEEKTMVYEDLVQNSYRKYRIF